MMRSLAAQRIQREIAKLHAIGGALERTGHLSVFALAPMTLLVVLGHPPKRDVKTPSTTLLVVSVFALLSISVAAGPAWARALTAVQAKALAGLIMPATCVVYAIPCRW
jgi:hypothetical protein